MKTPDKIKLALACCCAGGSCRRTCPYDGPEDSIEECTGLLAGDALTYIQQLEKRLADVNASPFDGGMSQAEYLNGEAGKDAE